MRKLLLGVLALAIGVVSLDGAEIEDLIKKLSNKDSDLRRQAAKELSELGPDAKSAVPALTTALEDKDLFVRRFAAEALGKIGPDAKSAVPALRKASKDSRKEMQQAAVEALGKMGPEAVDALISAVSDTSRDAQARRLAAQGLGAIGAPAHKAVKPLTTALTGGGAGKGKPKGPPSEGDIRVALVNALGELATASDTAALSAVRNLTERKTNRNQELRQAAANAVKKIEERKK
jgi:HEAT repeat protein